MLAIRRGRRRDVSQRRRLNLFFWKRSIAGAISESGIFPQPSYQMTSPTFKSTLSMCSGFNINGRPSSFFFFLKLISGALKSAVITIGLGSGWKSWENWIQYYGSDRLKVKQLDPLLTNMYISVCCRWMKAKSSPGVWCALEWKQNKEQKRKASFAQHNPANTTNITGGGGKQIN